MLPGYEGRRYYVNALTGYGNVRATRKPPTTSYSVHGAYHGGWCVAAFYAKMTGGAGEREGVRRERALGLADELNAEHDAWERAA